MICYIDPLILNFQYDTHIESLRITMHHSVIPSLNMTQINYLTSPSMNLGLYNSYGFYSHKK